MIDRHAEQLLTLAAAAADLPGRNGKPTAAYATVYRWARRGIAAGPRLESLRIGGQIFTSREAMDRFLAACAAAAEPAERKPIANRRRPPEVAVAPKSAAEIRNEVWTKRLIADGILSG
jgi:hypothetical protein